MIEIAPLAYMRGRTLNDSFVILDEAQNTTIEQMKMFLTRIGFGSVAVVTGDMTQSRSAAQHAKSGLRDAIEVLRDVDGISFTFFTARDVVRHPLVRAHRARLRAARSSATPATDAAMSTAISRYAVAACAAMPAAALSFRRWVEAGAASRRCRASPAPRELSMPHRRRARRPRAQPRIPRQGLRHQRAVVSRTNCRRA